MGLVVARAVGDDVFVGDTRLEVIDIIHAYKYKIRVYEGWRMREETVTDRESVDIAEKITLSAGLDGSNDSVKLHFEGPRSVPILRGEIYRQKYPEKFKDEDHNSS